MQGERTFFFAITASFLPKLRRFLDLRKYLLDGADFDYLFFSLNGRDGSPEKLTRFSHSSNVTSFKKILPCYPGIMPRKWRANLGDWATDNADISTTAVLLQNDQKTVARHYGRGTKKKMIKEVGGFLKEIEVRIESPIKRLGSTSCAVGTCGDPNNPSGGDVDNAVKPDCRLPEGCLFCEKYFVIADDVDVRKLISCEFCIFQTKSFSSNSAEWEATFRPILQRITAIADKIGRASSELASLVERVRKEVYEDGVLDKYWARKLDLTLALWGEL